jgi:hypothetical protein
MVNRQARPEPQPKPPAPRPKEDPDLSWMKQAHPGVFDLELNQAKAWFEHKQSQCRMDGFAMSRSPEENFRSSHDYDSLARRQAEGQRADAIRFIASLKATYKYERLQMNPFQLAMEMIRPNKLKSYTQALERLEASKAAAEKVLDEVEQKWQTSGKFIYAKLAEQEFQEREKQINSKLEESAMWSRVESKVLPLIEEREKQERTPEGELQQLQKLKDDFEKAARIWTENPRAEITMDVQRATKLCSAVVDEAYSHEIIGSLMKGLQPGEEKERKVGYGITLKAQWEDNGRLRFSLESSEGVNDGRLLKSARKAGKLVEREIDRRLNPTPPRPPLQPQRDRARERYRGFER